LQKWATKAYQDALAKKEEEDGTAAGRAAEAVQEIVDHIGDLSDVPGVDKLSKSALQALKTISNRAVDVAVTKAREEQQEASLKASIDREAVEVSKKPNFQEWQGEIMSLVKAHGMPFVLAYNLVKAEKENAILRSKAERPAGRGAGGKLEGAGSPSASVKIPAGKEGETKGDIARRLMSAFGE
jgi:hypothetical protein